MRNSAGQSHAKRALAAAAFAGNDQKIAGLDGQRHVIEDRHLLFIMDIRKMFHRDDALLCRLQVVAAVIGGHALFFQ